MSDDVLADGERLLETLHRKDCERARARITSAPLTLTDHDFVVLTNYGGEGEAARAYKARQQAQLAIVHKHTPAVETKGVEPAAPADMEAFLKKYGPQAGDVEGADPRHGR